MDNKENIHLEIAKNLLNERQLAENISRAIYNSLDSLDAQLQRMIQEEINEYGGVYEGELETIKLYCKERINELKVLAGIYTFNPKGCSGEQTYKFIQEFTQISWVETQIGDLAHASHFNNFTEGQFLSLIDED